MSSKIQYGVHVFLFRCVQIADIAAGGWHSLALSVQGGVFTWGRGEYGRLGIGDTSGSSKLRPHKVSQGTA